MPAGDVIDTPHEQSYTLAAEMLCSHPLEMSITVIGIVMRPSISSTASYLFQKLGKSFNIGDSSSFSGPIAPLTVLIPVGFCPFPLFSGRPVPRNRRQTFDFLLAALWPSRIGTALARRTCPTSLSSAKIGRGRERRRPSRLTAAFRIGLIMPRVTAVVRTNLDCSILLIAMP